MAEVCVHRKMRKHPQVDLGVVCRDKDPAVVTGYECLSDFAPDLGSGWDVLQVGVDAADTSRRRAGLEEGGVNLPVRRDISHQRIRIGSLDLGQLTELQNKRNRWMFVLDCLQGFDVSARTCFGFLGRSKSQHVEEEHAQLFWRLKAVVMRADELVRLALQFGNTKAELRPEGSQICSICAYACHLHVREHRCKRNLHLVQGVGKL